MGEQAAYWVVARELRSYPRKLDPKSLEKPLPHDGGKMTAEIAIANRSALALAADSPAECTGAIKTPIEGKPDPKHISTSYAERANLTMRMHMRRFTRLTNGFSKKIENHAHQAALHFMYYNFVSIHSALRMTPAMAAGVSDRLWEVSDIVALLEANETKSAKRGTYVKRAA